MREYELKDNEYLIIKDNGKFAQIDLNKTFPKSILYYEAETPKPSPLEALENIKKLFVGSPIDLSQQFDIIETALQRNVELEDIISEITSGEAVVISAEKHIAFEIIQEKRVNVDLLMRSHLVEIYNMEMGTHNELHKWQALTEQEFNAIKEELL